MPTASPSAQAAVADRPAAAAEPAPGVAGPVGADGSVGPVGSMTSPDRSRRRLRRAGRTSRVRPTVPREPVELLPARPTPYVAGNGLLVIAILLISLTVAVTLLSGLENRAAQHRASDRLREILAKGTAPVAAVDADRHLLTDGSPVALLSIPSIGLEQVVLFGTSASVLMDGPGLRRDSVLPGQSGAAVVLGRAWSYGGAFRRIFSIPAGSVITVTTGQGQSEYRTSNGPRYSGDPVPVPLGRDEGRLTLVSSYGPPFIPTGTVRIDAALTGPAKPTPAHLPASVLQPAELAMAADHSQAWALVLLLQLLLVLTVAAVVAWKRWGRIQTWIVFTPPILYVGMYLSDELTRFLPNLL